MLLSIGLHLRSQNVNLTMPNQLPTQPLPLAPGKNTTTNNGFKTHESLLAGRYQIVKVLGRGGFGITYLAHNIYLPGQPLCVIKHLVPKFTNAALLPIVKWRFFVEARTLGRLGSHSQIPLLLDYFRQDQEIYLVQEYIPGETLSNMVRNNAPLTEEKVSEFLASILHLLSYIHSNRLIHRDIKPQNIIYCQTDRRWVLIDFGAVSDRDGYRASDSRLIVKAIGTPGYAPPEQVSEQPLYASDIYALGMTCLFLLTGKEPLAFNVNPRTCEVVWRSEVTVSNELADIIDRMIKVSVADRYQSAIQVLHALESCHLRNKLRRYMTSKYATNTAEQAQLPPVVQWALELGK